MCSRKVPLPFVLALPSRTALVIIIVFFVPTNKKLDTWRALAFKKKDCLIVTGNQEQRM